MNRYSIAYLCVALILLAKVYPTTYICSSVYCDQKGDESMFPNSYSPHKSSSAAFQKIYWECATVMFASSLRCNAADETIHYILFTNKQAAPEPYRAILDDLGVKVISLPFAHVPPDGWHHAYKNSVYTLDMIQYLATIMENRDYALILDADVVWVDSCERLIKAIDKEESLQLHISYPKDHKINGLSLDQARTIYETLLERKMDGLPIHTGGEFVGATGLSFKKIAAEIDPVWQNMLTRFENQKPTFNTEEHFLSFIYHKLGMQHNANQFIRRIGTDESIMRTVDGKEFELTLWHMPAEKPRGFKILFKLLQDKRSLFWTSNNKHDFAMVCAKACHIL